LAINHIGDQMTATSDGGKIHSFLDDFQLPDWKDLKKLFDSTIVLLSWWNENERKRHKPINIKWAKDRFNARMNAVTGNVMHVEMWWIDILWFDQRCLDGNGSRIYSKELSRFADS
jgi:hypothetical protein